MKVLEPRCALDRIVEMWFQSTTLQEAVGHLRQVDPNDGIRIPETCARNKYKVDGKHDGTLCSRRGHGEPKDSNYSSLFLSRSTDGKAMVLKRLNSHNANGKYAGAHI